MSHPANETTPEIRNILIQMRQEHPDLPPHISDAEIQATIAHALTLIQTLDARAYHPTLPKTPEEAQHIKAIWLLTAPGTYDKPLKDYETKDSPFNRPWYAWMQRRRINYCFWLMERLAEIRTGSKVKGAETPFETRKLIGKYGPWLIVNGNAAENADLREVLTRPSIPVPAEKVFIIDDPRLVRTIDQVQIFSLPPKLEVFPTDQIGLVSHAPHMVRALYMLAQPTNKFPPITLQLYPMPIPTIGREAHIAQEVTGLLYYIYKKNLAAKTPYSKILL
jgi:hypothetical protein